jgi:hypothetical protein
LLLLLEIYNAIILQAAFRFGGVSGVRSNGVGFRCSSSGSSK